MLKKRKRRKMRQETIVFDEKKLAQVIPGMLKSADELFKFGNTIKDNDTLSVLSFGNTVSTTMITAQCSELLLKYKLQQEGKKIEKTHELYKLFKPLSEESQKEIENNFKAYISTLTFPLPKGWENVESVFQKANDAFVYWRYIAAVNNPNNELKTIYPYPLYIAALSIYKTTPIANLQFSREEVTDPEIKAAIFGRSTDK